MLYLTIPPNSRAYSHNSQHGHCNLLRVGSKTARPVFHGVTIAIIAAKVAAIFAPSLRQTMTDSILKISDITLPTKVNIVKAMVFPGVVYGCESWTIKKVECQKMEAFELWCGEDA